MMIQFKRIGLFVTMSFLLFSCFGDKNGRIQISGTIYQEGTSIPISGANVYLFASNDSYRRLAETSSNNDGKYNFDLEIKKVTVSTFKIVSIFNGIKDNKDYYGIGKNEVFDKKVTIDVEIPEQKKLILKLINKSKSLDYSGIKLLDYEGEYEDLYIEDDGYIQTHYGKTAYGMDVDTIFELPIPNNYIVLAKFLSYQMIYPDGSLKYKERASIKYTGSDSLYHYATFEY